MTASRLPRAFAACVRLGLALGGTLLPGAAWAALPQVTNLRVQTDGPITWDGLPGAAGYNVYRGDVAGLRAGNYGGCLIGSVQGLSASPPADPVPAGTAIFFLADGFDETGEGQVGDTPSANPSPRCIPARRIFALTADGDPGDGVADGRDSLRNPSALLWSSPRETTGIYRHTGEFFVSAVDLNIPGRVPTEEARELAMSGLRLKNTVVISHKPSPPAGPSHQVNFYTYGAGDAAEEDLGIRQDWAMLDAMGHRGVPLICTNCHGGTYHAVLAGGSKYVSPGWQDQPDVYRRVIVPYCIACHSAAHSSASAALSRAYRAARSYRSQVRYNGPLGNGWDLPANARVATGGSNVLYFDGTGRQETYVRLDATHFAPAAGRYAQLLQNGDGSFTLRDRDGSLQNFHAFDGSNRQGVLESTVGRQGDRAAFLYDSQGLLVTVVDPLGRAVAYTYNPDGRIASITDFAGRQVIYSYDPLAWIIHEHDRPMDSSPGSGTD